MATQVWRGHVKSGRLVLDVPIEHPDGEVQVGLIGSAESCDYLLFVVTETEEAQLLAAAQQRGLRVEARQCVVGEYHDLGDVGASRLHAIRIDEGVLRHRGSAAQAIRWMDRTGAQAVIGVGMAFGVDRKTQQHRDVLVSTHLLPYDQRTLKSHHEIPLATYPRVQALPASRGLLGILDREIGQPRARSFQVHRGALLSGGAKIHSRTFLAHLLTALGSRGQPIVGGEMEGAGLLGAADPAAWLVVKGIVDFADEARDQEFKEHREEACRNAAGLVLDAFLRAPGEKPVEETR